MHTHPWADVGIRLVSLLWAGCMSLAGMWLAAGTAQSWSAVRGAAWWAGVGMIAGSQVVFLAMVADRYFPRAQPLLVLICELAGFGIFIVGLGRAAWMLLLE
jgi:hypothetical protein